MYFDLCHVKDYQLMLEIVMNEDCDNNKTVNFANYDGLKFIIVSYRLNEPNIIMANIPQSVTYIVRDSKVYYDIPKNINDWSQLKYYEHRYGTYNFKTLINKIHQKHMSSQAIKHAHTNIYNETSTKMVIHFIY